jgi:RND family efflux transporter MFP subunit
MKPLACLSFALLLAGCNRHQAHIEKMPTPVHVAEVEMLKPATGEKYSASLMPDRQVTLSFKVSGFVESIRQIRGADGRVRSLDIGDFVQQGAELARVRAKDYQLQVEQVGGQLDQARQNESVARAQLADAEAAANRAALEFERARGLYADKAMTKPDYDSAKAQYDSTRAKVDAARYQIQAAAASGQMSQAALGTARLGLHDASLAAPFSGAVLQRSIELGSLVAPGTAAFTLVDISSVRATFGVPDTVVVHLKTGAKLDLAAEALPDRTFAGIVTSIAAAADSSTRLFQVQVTIPNAQGILRPGMIANLALANPAASVEALPVIPVGAVVRAKENGGGFAVVLIDGKLARRQPVELCGNFGDRVAIRGLKPGDRVIRSGAALISDGEVVEVIP